MLDPGQFTDPNPAPQLRIVDDATDIPEAVDFDERPDPTDAYDLTSGERAVDDDPIRVYELGPDLDF